jgi:hypothetical protein
MATGVVIFLTGLWVLLRTVRTPTGGRNLVDLLVGPKA